MSKESTRDTIERVKGDIAKERAEIASLRAQKSADSARYAAQIQNTRDATAKANIRRQKADSAARYDQRIALRQTRIAGLQQWVAQLRAQLKSMK